MTYLEAGLEVLKIMEMNGYEAYFVGGFVRDFILKYEPNDIDIATNALPEQLENIFEVIKTGIKYNSITIVYEGYQFEATTYRIEGAYHDNRHPVYQIASSLTDDLKRRDFTINAMAMNKDFLIVDLFDGQVDIKNKVIKTVYDPYRRFNEDALRMLRACYFSAKLGFEIEHETFNAIKKLSHLVQSLSQDRICWELEKLVNSKYANIGIKYLIDTNIAPYLVNFKDGLYILNSNSKMKFNWKEFLAISFYDHVNDLNEIHLKSTLAKEVKEAITLAKKEPKNRFTNADLFDFGKEVALIANKINVVYSGAKDQSKLINDNYDNLAIHTLMELSVKGQDIIDNVKLQNNKMVSVILQDVKEKVLLNKLENKKECIIKYIKKHYSLK